MSRIVNSGRLLAAGLFVFLGADLLWHAVAKIPEVLREHPQQVTYYFISDAVLWIPELLCAWGLFRWRRWGRTLGLVLSAMYVFSAGLSLGISLVRPAGFGLTVYVAVLMLIAGCVFTWLLLPAVRVEYSRRDQIA